MSIQSRIHHELDRLAAEESIKIIVAVESGSRAWGFPSQDSDYDVRFIYARDPWRYINVYKGRDVIERPIADELDISGWDLQKAFGLLRKSNPALMEWVNSPLIYRELQPQADNFRRLATQAFLPLASCHHYLSMAHGHQRRSARHKKVSLKHYLYSVRPCLAARWVVEYGTQPPMLFSKLVETFLPQGEIRQIVDGLITLKSGTSEIDTVDRIPALERFIAESLKEIEASLPVATANFSKSECNTLFRTMLKACWNEQ
ncbi:MAG: nucleotidyltransferase domain-containing protein [Phormidesmis sp.]